MSNPVVFAEKLVGQEWRVAVPVRCAALHPPPLLPHLLPPIPRIPKLYYPEKISLIISTLLARFARAAFTPCADGHQAGGCKHGACTLRHVAAALRRTRARPVCCMLLVLPDLPFLPSFNPPPPPTPLQSVLFNLKTKQPSGAANSICI